MNKHTLYNTNHYTMSDRTSLLATLNPVYVNSLVAILNNPDEYDKLCEDTYSTSKGLSGGLMLTITYMGIEVLYEHRVSGCGTCEVSYIDRLNDTDTEVAAGMGDRLLGVLKQAERCYSCNGWFVTLLTAQDRKYCSMCFMDCLSSTTTGDCAICLEPLQDMSVWNLSLLKGNCKHEFHQKCLFTLSRALPNQIRFRCPLCRGGFLLT